MTVLVLAQDKDSPADQIVLDLAEREVPVFRADLSWFPRRLDIHAELRDGRWVGQLASPARTVDLEDIRSVWYRDPSGFRFAPELSDVERAHAYRESRLGLGGVLAALPVLWVNNPNRAADAMYKPLQLSTASACGLTVAPTLVTNRPASVAAFAHTAPGGIVCKTFGGNSVTEEGVLKVAYTHRLDADDLRDLRAVASCAHQLQLWVDKTREARVVIVGERMFAVAIDAGTERSRVDWRADFDALHYELVDVPAEVERGLRQYMSAFGLVYAACDFCVDRDGRWIFLESNSGGQYAWLEAATGAPISAALADLLALGVADARVAS